MRTPTVSHGEDQPARIALPVLARLPDLDSPTHAGNFAALPTADAEEFQDSSGRSGNRRRSRKKTNAPPVDREPAGRWTKLKSQLLLTFIILAFVLLIGTLIFHRGSSPDEHSADGWNDIAAQDNPAPNVVTMDSPPALPERLPPVIQSTRDQSPAANSTAPSLPPTDNPHLALEGPANEPAATQTSHPHAVPGVAQLDGTIEPAHRQAQEATYPNESIR